MTTTLPPGTHCPPTAPTSSFQDDYGSPERSRRTRRGPSARPSSHPRRWRDVPEHGAPAPSTRRPPRRPRSTASASSTSTCPGYLHRGVEKLCENADYHQTISQLIPEYISSLFCEIRSWRTSPGRSAAPPVHPGPLRRAQPDRQSRALHGLVRARPGGLTPILWRSSSATRSSRCWPPSPALGCFQLLPDRRRTAT